MRHFSAVLAFGLLGIFAAFLGTQFQGSPEATLPSEHANLLAAETLASGRLANPPHPAGFFLQTYLTLQSPTYTAAVPPGGPLLLAIGVVAGDPVYGIWFAAGVFAAASVWMLLGFVPLRWAWIGALLTILWFGFLSFWGQSFATPAATGTGMAILWGAVRRYRAKPGVGYAVLAGLGASWLWLSSPIGAMLAFPIPALLLYRTLYLKRAYRDATFFLGCIVLCVLLQLVINVASTGNAGVSASELYRQSYDVNPRFLWEPARPAPRFDFWRMEQYDLVVAETASRFATPVGATWLSRLNEQAYFYLGIPGFFMIAGGLLMGSSAWARWTALTCATILAGILFIMPWNMAFSAPLAPLCILLIVWSVRRVWLYRARTDWNGWRALWILISVFAIIALYRGFGYSIPKELIKHRAHKTSLINHLLKDEGADLVLVDYAIETPPQVEYVYNGANPDTQPIVWARWHASEDPAPLERHFPGRKPWVLTVGPEGEPQLRPLSWEALKQSRAQESSKGVGHSRSSDHGGTAESSAVNSHIGALLGQRGATSGVLG